MIIGVDFDNTIVCYDGLFRKLAVEQGLVPGRHPRVEERRARLPAADRTGGPLDRVAGLRLWPRHARGPAVSRGAGVFRPLPPRSARKCSSSAIARVIRFSANGTTCTRPPATFSPSMASTIRRGSAWRPTTSISTRRRQEKVAQINQVGCTHFIDDLPEILTAAELRAESKDSLRSQRPACRLPRPAARRFVAAIEDYLLGQSEGIR